MNETETNVQIPQECIAIMSGLARRCFICRWMRRSKKYRTRYINFCLPCTRTRYSIFIFVHRTKRKQRSLLNVVIPFGVEKPNVKLSYRLVKDCLIYGDTDTACGQVSLQNPSCSVLLLSSPQLIYPVRK